MNILIAVDHSRRSAEVAEAAGDLFGSDANSFTFLGVAPYEPAANGLGVGSHAELLHHRSRTIKASLRQAARTAAKRARSADVQDADISVRLGRRGPAICDAAHSCDADVIVMGMPKTRWWQRFGRSSAQRYVRQHADCPVMVIG
jgi:nucleotide-binding universal stress UspA family protein